MFRSWLREATVATLLTFGTFGSSGLAQTSPASPPAASQPGTPAAPPPAPAASSPSTAPQYPVVTVGVLSYLQYDAELENRDGFNAFDVTRGYVNINADVARHIRFRVTPDIRRITDGSLNGSLTFRLKYAFAQFDNVAGEKTWLRFGLHQTPWLDFEESINRYRVQGQMFAEREGVIPGSGDFGVGYFAPLPSGYGELNAGVYNGEGFSRTEVNKSKSVQVRGTVRPFPNAVLANGFRVSGFYNLGAYSPDHPRRHGIVMASFEQPHVAATAQWLAGTDRPDAALTTAHPRGTSLFAEIREGPEGWAGIVRLDRFDPDRSTSGNSSRRLIAGVAFWLTWSKSRVGIVASDEDVHYDTGRGRPDENRLLIQTHLQF